MCAWKSDLACGALIGALGALASLYCYTYSGLWWRSRLAEVKNGVFEQPRKVDNRVPEWQTDEILSEQFTRNSQFFGKIGQEQVHKAFVVVIGLGGVGSHAAHMLLRAGVGRLRLIDFDQVSLSSLNRHAVATRADVGLPKAVVLKEHFSTTVPEADIDAQVAMFSGEEAEALLRGKPDFVVDAIDDINTKVELLAACNQLGLTVISACGAGAKADPSRIRIADLSEASVDPLARKVRYLLRSQHNITTGIPMVVSAEAPRCTLIPVEELSHNPHDLQIVPNFRIRTVPVLGTTPAMFGMAAASWVLCQLASTPYIPEPLFHVKEKEYRVLLERLEAREEEVFGNVQGVSLDLEDIRFLVRDVWRAKSARALVVDSAGEKGLSRFVGGLHLTRWDIGKPASVDNLLLLTAEEANKHETTTLSELTLREPEFVMAVNIVLDSVRSAFGIHLFDNDSKVR